MITLILFIFGLIFGSFVNAYVWRFKKHKNWVSERSICPKCKKQLQIIDLVPVLSWLALKGKCRYCKKPISVQYPAVELLTALLFALSYIYWPYTFTLLGWLAFVVWLICVVLLISLLVYDAKWQLLPNKMVFALTVSATILVILLAIHQNQLWLLVESIIAGGAFFAFFWAIFIVSKGNMIGGGDVKLAVSLGLIVGSLVNVFLVVFLSSSLGTLIVLPFLVTKKLNQKSKIPFGSLLAVATIIVFLFNRQIIDWYSKTFLLIN